MARDTVAAVRTDLEETQRVIGTLATQDDLLLLTWLLAEQTHRLNVASKVVGAMQSSAPSAPVAPSEPVTPQPVATSAPAQTTSGIRCGRCSTRESAVYHASPADVKACYTTAS